MAFYYKCPFCDGLSSSKQLEPKDIKCPKCSEKYWALDNVIDKKTYDLRRKNEAGADLIKSAKKTMKKPKAKKVIKDARKSSKGDADGLAEKVEEFAVEGDQTVPEQDTNRVAERGGEMTEKKKDEDFEHTCGAKVTVRQARCPACGKALDWSEYAE